MTQKPKCGIQEITTIRTSNESHLYQKKHFRKKLLFLRLVGDFEADNETDNPSIGNKTTNIYKQDPVCNGFCIISELEGNLETGYFSSKIVYNNVGWFVNEFIKLQSKMAFYSKNTKKDIIMIKEDEEEDRNKNIRRLL